MGEIINRLLNGQSRIENGIFLADDTAILLDGNPETGFVYSAPTTVLKLDEKETDGWINADDEFILAESDDWIASSLNGAWEGEGFLVLRSKADNVLQWIIHLERAEQFYSATFEREILVAQSGEYPNMWEWRIPVKTPWQMEVARQDTI